MGGGGANQQHEISHWVELVEKGTCLIQQCLLMQRES